MAAPKWKLVLCSICNESQPRQADFTAEGKRFYFNPKTMLKWRGKRCPECLEIEDTLYEEAPKLTTRKCRDCSKYLPVTRYFQCEECVPILPSIDDEWIYESEVLDDHMISMADGLPMGGNDERDKDKETDDFGDLAD